jgi:hypothetical protein
MVRRFDRISSSVLHLRKLSGHREYVDSALANRYLLMLLKTNIYENRFR